MRLSVRLLGVCLAVVSLVAGSACGSAGTDSGGGGGEIAFTRGHAENNDITDIVVVNVDGSGQRRLVPFHAEDPAWSLDGKQIAFTRFPKLYASNSDLYVTDADGRAVRRLTQSREDESTHVWSPDGRRLAVVIEGEANSEVTYHLDVVETDGTGRRRLVPFQAGEPSWSPDGRQIAFARLPPVGAAEVYVVDADGTRLRRLTQSPPDGNGHESPTWSPDGRQIAFTDGLIDPTTRSSLYVMNADGSGLRRLAKSPAQPSGDLSPVWSPDGRRIAFTRVIASAVTDIYLVNADGSGLRRLTRTSDADEPAWSPHSRRIAFVRHIHDNSGADTADIFIVNADGTKLQRLTQTPALEETPVWSPQ